MLVSLALDPCQAMWSWLVGWPVRMIRARRKTWGGRCVGEEAWSRDLHCSLGARDVSRYLGGMACTGCPAHRQASTFLVVRGLRGLVLVSEECGICVTPCRSFCKTYQQLLPSFRVCQDRFCADRRIPLYPSSHRCQPFNYSICRLGHAFNNHDGPSHSQHPTLNLAYL